MSLPPAVMKGTVSITTLSLQSPPTLPAGRALLLPAGPGTAASLLRDTERSWSFKGGAVCGDSWLSVIPSRCAHSPGPGLVGVELRAGFLPGPPRVLSAKALMTRRSWTVKLAAGPGPAHVASIASSAQPWGPDGYAGHRDAGTPSCVSSQPTNTSRIRATLQHAPTTCQTPC